MTVRRLAVVSAGLSQPSSTRMLADRLANVVVTELEGQGVEAEVTVIELRDHARDLTSMMLTGFASPSLEPVITAVTGADGLIAVTPVFSASYSGLFKSFFDVLDPQALTGLPVTIAATAGTPRHSLVLDHALRPLFSYLRATVLPTGVFAATGDWGDDNGGELSARVARAGRELAEKVAVSDRSTANADPWGFDSVLSGAGSSTPL